MSKHRNKHRKGRLVDMSLPPELRGRARKQQVIGGTPPAQMDHATGSSSRHRRREGEQRMEAERARRMIAAEVAEEDPDVQLHEQRVEGRLAG